MGLDRRDSLGTLGSEVDGTDTLKAVRLELRSAKTERSDVISAWWRYALGAVVRELRQRRRIRKGFQERFLSFSWERRKYKCEEYVRLYIRSHLLKQSATTGKRAGG
jgi:hypothetical protein